MRIKQIISNLLSNAAKFTTQGGITISAKVIEHHDNSLLIQITVSDTGIGISAEALENIFKPFTQAESSTTRQFGGTGLGLTICRNLAELMGGSIEVESTLGAGSCFKLILPFDLAEQEISSVELTKQTTLDWSGPTLRVLFVEDNQINMAFDKVICRKLGFNGVFVENGRECLAALERETFDVVLMDIQMPIMSGEEVRY